MTCLMVRLILEKPKKSLSESKNLLRKPRTQGQNQNNQKNKTKKPQHNNQHKNRKR